jgi:tRNA threonylcarbamoyladenosine biosynthesis protein TsaB
MNILALDTACPVFSAALATDTGNWYFEADAGMRHSELLMELIDTLFKYAGLDPPALDFTVCMKGPGSFTGLRIGYAAAKGLALALSIPFAAVSTLDCIAFPHSAWPGIVVPVIDAKKTCFFSAFYRYGERISPYMDEKAEKIAEIFNELSEKETQKQENTENVLLTGPGAEIALAVLSKLLPEIKLFTDPNGKKGRAYELLTIAKTRDLFNNDSIDIFSGPDYLRKSDAEFPRRRGISANHAATE